jgi:L-asparaginase
MQTTLYSEPIAILSAGGTFEKIYDPIGGQLRLPNHSRLSQWAQQARLHCVYRIEEIFLKDSLDMVDADRRLLSQRIAQAKETRIVVIHGTDTMTDSAEVLAKHLRPEQVVVLTGAMVPASLEASDALINLGGAVAAVQLLPPGVWVSIQGQIFSALHVQKNRSLALFEPTSQYRS